MNILSSRIIFFSMNFSFAFLFSMTHKQEELARKAGIGFVEGVVVGGLVLPPLLKVSNTVIETKIGQPVPHSVQNSRRWLQATNMFAGKVGATTGQEAINHLVLQALSDSDLSDTTKQMYGALVAASATAPILNIAELHTTMLQKGLKLSREQFIKTLRRSSLATTFRETPFVVVHLAMAKELYGVLRERTPLDSASAMGLSIALAGSAAAVVSQPGHVVKTAIHSDPDGLRFSGTIQAARELIKEKGFASLFSGGTIRVVAVPVTIALILGIRALGTQVWPLRSIA